MGDVADILGMGKQASTTNDEASRILGDKLKAKPIIVKKPKPKGMSRELVNLIGTESIAPVVVTNKSGGPLFKSKRFNTLQGKWIWAPFKNSARSDGQQFYHWVKGDLQNMDYSYSKFNVKIEPINYTDDEYDRLLHAPLWTRSETDHLMHICYKYNLRWSVIVDRYESLPSRTTEELQSRYYSIVVKLRDARAGCAEGTKRPEARSVFDFDFERTRRTQQEILFRKTKEDELEEVRLREELKLIDSSIKKIKKNTKWNNATEKSSAKAESKQGSGNVTASSVLSSSEQLPQPMPGKPCLQSTRLAAAESGVGISKSLVKKMNSMLRELMNIPEKMLPTRTVCDLFDGIRRDTVCLLSLQAALAKKEKELATLRSQHPSLCHFHEITVPHYDLAGTDGGFEPSMAIVAAPAPAAVASLPRPIVPAVPSKQIKKAQSQKRKSTSGSAASTASAAASVPAPTTAAAQPTAAGGSTAALTPSTSASGPSAAVPAASLPATSHPTSQKQASKKAKKQPS